MRTRHGWMIGALVVLIGWIGGSARADTAYVGPGSGTAPYGDWGSATTNLQAAVTQVQGTIGASVVVSNGTFYTTNTIVLNTNITIQGYSLNYSNTVIARTGTNLFRLFTLSTTSAVLDSLTITNGNYITGAGILMTNGTVQNCRITTCIYSNSGGYGGGVYMVGGVLTNCTIENCKLGYGATYSAAYGGGIWMGAGLVVGCTIRNNLAADNGTANASKWGGGVYATSGVIRASIITGNSIGGGTGSTTEYGTGVYLAGNASLIQCMVSSNSVAAGGAPNGGAVYVGTANNLVENCVICANQVTGLSTTTTGGGIYLVAGTVRDCTVAGNVIPTGGNGPGVYRSGGVIVNTIVSGNQLANGQIGNYSGSATVATNCCAPELTAGTNGNITGNPLFNNASALDFHLHYGSPCIDAGTNLAAVTVDYDGNARPVNGAGPLGAGTSRSDIGAYEAPTYTSGVLRCFFTAAPVANLTSVTPTFTPYIAGSPDQTNISSFAWDYGAGGAGPSGPGAPGVVSHTFGLGQYTITLTVTNTAGSNTQYSVANLIQVLGATNYVASGGSGTYPYSSWATATTNLSDAVTAARNVAVAGLGVGSVVVSNGTFYTTNEIFLDTNIVVQGYSGQYTNTVIARTGANAFRLFTLSAPGAVLDSLTITNGQAADLTPYGAGIYMTTGTVRNCRITTCKYGAINVTCSGGGVYMTGGVLTNCTIQNCQLGLGNNYPALYGGGVWMSGGLVVACTILRNALTYTSGNNPVWGGGVYASGGKIYNSIISSNSISGDDGGGGTSEYGSGVYLAGNASLIQCMVSSNSMPGGNRPNGGAVYVGTANNRVESCGVWSNRVTGSSTATTGGGIDLVAGTVINCTVAGNVIPTNGYPAGAGLYQAGGAMVNTIVYGNRWANGTVTNYYGGGGSASNSCAPELTVGVNGNSTGNPGFKNAAANDYHLASGSPCIGQAIYQAWMATASDLDGNPRSARLHVDMGAYETAAVKGTAILFQ